MTTQYFKVRNGLSVGEDAVTVDAATGNVVATGDITVKDTVTIQGSSSGSSAFSAPATGSTLSYVLPGAGGAASTVLTNDGSGNLSWALPGGGGSTFGNVTVGVDTDQTISTTSGNLILQTAAGVNAGTITMAAGANGAITVAPNGTGDVALTLNNGGNLTNTRNYVLGTIRNATTDSIGDIWAVNSTGPVAPYRGISLDNSADTTKGPGAVVRSFSGGAVAGSGTRGRVVFEKARGTSASPTAVGAGDLLGSIDVTGYTSTGWVNDNIVAAAPGVLQFGATENWVSNTNLGTSFSLTMAPQATTISTAANLVNVISAQPEVIILKGDRVALAQSKTLAFNATGCSTSGTTLTIGTLVSGTIATGQVLQLTTGSPINGVFILANISGSGSGSTWTLSQTPGTLSGLTINGYAGFLGGPTAGTSTDVLQNLRLVKNTILSSTSTTQIVTSAGGATLDLRGDTTTIDNAANTSTYASFAPTVGSINQDTFTIKNTAGTTTYGNFTSTGTTISGAGLSTVSRTTVGTPGSPESRPSMNIQLIRSDQAAPNDNDNTSFRTRVGGSNGLFYTISDIGSVYRTSGDVEFRLNLANGDQTTGSFSGLSILSSKISETRIKAGTPSATPGASTVSDVAILSPTTNTLRSDAFTLTDYAGVALVGNKISYNRVYGQWQNLNTITPAAANTAYAFALPTTDYNNIATVASTSQITPGALGFYKMQFSVQVLNTDNAAEHTAFFWWRKNGTDVPGSMGRLTVPRGAVGGELIAGWDNMVQVTSLTDYWELMYAVEDVALTFPFYASTAFGPSTASLFVTLVPVGA